jgi:hypothetical protein
LAGYGHCPVRSADRQRLVTVNVAGCRLQKIPDHVDQSDVRKTGPIVLAQHRATQVVLLDLGNTTSEPFP